MGGLEVGVNALWGLGRNNYELYMGGLEVGVKVVGGVEGDKRERLYVVNLQTARNICKQQFVSRVLGCSFKVGDARTLMCVHTCLRFIARSTYPYTVRAWGEYVEKKLFRDAPRTTLAHSCGPNQR